MSGLCLKRGPSISLARMMKCVESIRIVLVEFLFESVRQKLFNFADFQGRRNVLLGKILDWDRSID